MSACTSSKLLFGILGKFRVLPNTFCLLPVTHSVALQAGRTKVDTQLQVSKLQAEKILR